MKTPVAGGAPWPKRRIVWVMIALWCFSAGAWSWNELGHMVVAQIAYQRLTPRTRAQVDRLLAVPVDPRADMAKTSTFVTAACWADDVRSTFPETAPWHYIDIPLSLDGTKPDLQPEAMDVVKAIDHAETALRDPLTSDTQKAQELRYLIHFVGDIHQPLHCVTGITAARPGGDRGGNSVPIRGFETAHNLHAVWDSGVGLFGANFVTDRVARPLDDAGTSKVLTMANRFTGLYPDSLIAGQSLNPQDWAQEGWQAAKDVVYPGITDGGTISADYMKKAQPLVEQRIAMAGYRLAAVLNGIFDPPRTQVSAAKWSPLARPR